MILKSSIINDDAMREGFADRERIRCGRGEAPEPAIALHGFEINRRR